MHRMPAKLRPLLVVLNYTPKDAHLAVAALEACYKLDGQRNGTILLTGPAPGNLGDEVGKAAAFAFDRVEGFAYDDWSGEKKWPQPQSWGWQQVARHLTTYPQSKAYSGWFWWEPDATPIRPGWIEKIAEAHCLGKKLFSGVPCVTPPDWRYMNGVGIYPFDIIEPLANVSALFNVESPFDVMAGPAVMRSFTDLSSLMLHDRKMRGGGAGRTFDDVDVQLLLKRHPNAVFYHGCDESLPFIVAGKQPPQNRAKAAAPAFPSLFDQTGWECGLFTFPASKTPTVHYNCSIVNDSNGPLLLTRRQRFYSGPEVARLHSTNTNDLSIWRIRKNMTLEHLSTPRTPARYTHEQWEDPRGMRGKDGNIYVSFATWVHGENWMIRQSLCLLRGDLTKLDVVSEPHYGGNHSIPEKGSGHEKNWCWFEHNGQWHFVYTIAPHCVVTDIETKPFTYEEHSAMPWKTGTPRGGTPPIRVGDEYWSFFHSSTPDKKWRRRYYMGAYAFKAEPPFQITRITEKPLLTASEADFNNLDSPLVVFPNGALIQEDKWLVVFGVNDEHSGWIKIPHGDLQARMVKV